MLALLINPPPFRCAPSQGTEVPPQGPLRFGDPTQGIESATYSCVYADANNGRRRLQNEDETPTFCTAGTGAGRITLGDTNTQTQSGYNLSLIHI